MITLRLRRLGATTKARWFHRLRKESNIPMTTTATPTRSLMKLHVAVGEGGGGQSRRYRTGRFATRTNQWERSALLSEFRLSGPARTDSNSRTTTLSSCTTRRIRTCCDHTGLWRRADSALRPTFNTPTRRIPAPPYILGKYCRLPVFASSGFTASRNQHCRIATP